MSAFNFDETMERVQRRATTRRKPRRDRGSSRLHPQVEAWLCGLLSVREKPSFSVVQRELRAKCEAEELPGPTRTSIYNAARRVPVPSLRWDELPEAVTTSLYNLAPDDADDTIPGDQVVFYAFNYGAPRALSYASGLPWICLARANARRGWRPKSHSLLRAVMRFRGIT